MATFPDTRGCLTKTIQNPEWWVGRDDASWANDIHGVQAMCCWTWDVGSGQAAKGGSVGVPK
jgi:hypothetical protein